ncbi:hypothetical protein GOB93_03280 [Acetobacter musti]|uniref:Uncharacterized protein n=1 Tax=Acetobacter musti TaxID=864732 RepID=A0ABX0JNN2_9PROT|nr:hypothetical protein [Acetobacter musti]NHN83662.1 hypothetical protein [Acetobacter musti]
MANSEEKTVRVVTKRLIYDKVDPGFPTAPRPVGSHLTVPESVAAFWESRGIARRAGDAEVAPAVVAAGVDGAKTAPPPPAPPMTPPPKTAGSPAVPS